MSLGRFCLLYSVAIVGVAAIVEAPPKGSGELPVLASPRVAAGPLVPLSGLDPSFPAGSEPAVPETFLAATVAAATSEAKGSLDGERSGERVAASSVEPASQPERSADEREEPPRVAGLQVASADAAPTETAHAAPFASFDATTDQAAPIPAPVEPSRTSVDLATFPDRDGTAPVQPVPDAARLAFEDAILGRLATLVGGSVADAGDTFEGVASDKSVQATSDIVILPPPRPRLAPIVVTSLPVLDAHGPARPGTGRAIVERSESGRAAPVRSTAPSTPPSPDRGGARELAKVSREEYASFVSRRRHETGSYDLPWGTADYAESGNSDRAQGPGWSFRTGRR